MSRPVLPPMPMPRDFVFDGRLLSTEYKAALGAWLLVVETLLRRCRDVG